MQNLLATRLRLLLLLAVFMLALPTRALTIKIGTLQTIPQVDPFGFGVAAYQACFGLQAAFNEANDRQLLGSGVEVQLSVRGAQPANVTNATLDLLQNESAVMIAAPSLSTTYVIINMSRSMRFPLLGQQVTEAFSVNDPAVTSIINYRFSYAQELWHMINIAVNSKLRCKRFAIVAAAGIMSKHAIRMEGYLNSLGHVNVTRVPAGNATLNAQSIAAINASQPQCVFYITDANTIQNFSLTLLNQPWVQPSNLFFITWSGVTAASWPLRMANRTFIVQQVPSPIDTKYDLVRSYQAALAALDAKGYYDPPGKGYNLTYGYGRAAAITPSYTSLEAYIVGRLAVDILRRLPRQDYTWSSIINAVYDGKMFAINDTLLGPYMAGCNGQVAQTGVSCYCNSGNKVLYTSYVGPSGTLLPYHTDAALLENPSAASLEMPMPVCLFPDGEVRTPTLYVSVHEVPFMFANPNTYSKGIQYQTMFVATQVAITTAGVGRPNLGDLVVVNEAVMSMDQATLQQLADRYPLAAFAGGVHSANFTFPGVASLAGYDGGRYMLTDPPLSQWREESIALEPVIADFVHALAAKLSGDIDASAAAPAITIFATSVAEAELAAKSLHTFQLLFDTPVTFDTWRGSLAEVQSLRAELLSRREPGHVIFVVSQKDSFVDAIVKEASTTMTQQPFYVATEEETLERSMDAMTAAELGAFSAATHNMFFSSVLPPFWQRNAPTAVMTVVSVYDSLRSNMGLNHSFALLRGCRMAVATYSALDGVFNVITTNGYRTVWYTQGSVSSLDLMYGPFSNAPCSPHIVEQNAAARKCQCSKGVRKFFVHSLTDWALQTPHAQPNVTFSYTHEGCGATYDPLIVPRPADHLTVILTATIMSGVAALMLVVAVYCGSRPARDNTCAPKDPYSPYTVVFTDIQSSTALWARVPQQMADAVETHHAIIRELIRSQACYEVKTIGDSFMVACKDPKAAARLALDLQLAFFRHEWGTSEIDSAYHDLEREWAEGLAEQQHDLPSVVNINTTAVVQNSFNPLFWNGLRVRIGIHHGFGEIRQDHVTHGYDYYGTVVNTAARVEGVGHGGQVLLTEAAFDAAGGYHADSAFADASVTCLGPQPLRGLDQPVVLYQVIPGKLKGREFRPLRLDVERDIESESDASGSDTASQHSTLDVTPEMLAQRAARRAKGDLNYGSYFNEVLHAHAVVVHLFSTQSEKQKRHLLEQVAHKWRVPLRKSTDKSISAQDLYERQLMTVMLKVYAAYDKKISTGSKTGTQSQHGTHPGGSFMGEDKDGSASDIVSLTRNRDATVVVSPTHSGKGQLTKGQPGSGHSGRVGPRLPTIGVPSDICDPGAHDDIGLSSVESDAHPDVSRPQL